MQDKMMAWQQLETSIENINNYKTIEKRNEKYVEAQDQLISEIEAVVSYSGEESTKSLINKLDIGHQEYACKRAFFNLKSDQFRRIFQTFNEVVLGDLIEYLTIKKHIPEDHLTKKFGEKFVFNNKEIFYPPSKKKLITKFNPYEEDFIFDYKENIKTIDDLNLKLSYAQADNSRLKKEVSVLKKSIATLENEKSDIESQLNDKFNEEVKNTLGRFVNKAMSELKIKEKKYTLMSLYWIAGGGIACIGILASVISIMIWMSNVVSSNNNISWSLLIYYVGKGAVILSALSTLAYYCFKQSNAYVHESLKQGERVHAIRFGQLCLRLYGKQINENQIKNVFEDWNISSNTAFSNNSKEKENINDIPANITEVFKSAIESLSKK
ncbi:hypothetical protein M8R90_11090 [Enterobacter hormaechei]|nr:hypothetical protein [Enterobacter hormaechei]